MMHKIFLAIMAILRLSCAYSQAQPAANDPVKAGYEGAKQFATIVLYSPYTFLSRGAMGWSNDAKNFTDYLEKKFRYMSPSEGVAFVLGMVLVVATYALAIYASNKAFELNSVDIAILGVLAADTGQLAMLLFEFARRIYNAIHLHATEDGASYA